LKKRALLCPPGMTGAGWARTACGLVGLVEELLLRGLVYRALYEWRGTRLAILGSSPAFGLSQAGWMGVLGALGVSLIGAVFGMIRWRSGGIVALIAVHGLLDIIGKEMYPGLTVERSRQLHIVCPWLAILADLMLLSVVVYLWKAHPWVDRMTSAHAGRGGAGR
jgi:membrane protease YdiL (CAAX protease family)